jgi:hypothetical protein
VTGADDRFGVLAYEGVGPGHFAACAARPFETSGKQCLFVGHFDKLSANGVVVGSKVTCSFAQLQPGSLNPI